MLSAFVVIALLSLPVCGEEIIRSSGELELACQENRRNTPFEISGTIVLPPTVPKGFFTLLSENRMFSIVDMRTNQSERASSCYRMGDRVIVRGRIEPYRSKLKSTANCYTLQVVDTGSLPTVTPIGLGEFLSSKQTNRRIVALRGSLLDVFPDDIDVQHIYAVLGDGTNSVNLICNCPQSWLPGFRTLLGCDVVVTGVTVGWEET